MAIVESDVTAWVDFSDGSGSTATDQSTNGQDITLVNTPTWSGDALSFDKNSSEYGTWGTSLIPNSAFTVSMWLNADSGWGSISNYPLGRNASLIIGNQATNVFWFRIFDGTSWSSISQAWSTTGSLFHVVCNWNGSTTMRLIINDGTVNSTTQNTMANTGNTLHLAGYNPTGDGRYWDGLIEDIAIFNRVLTATEITDLYNSGSVKTFSDYFSGGGGGTNTQLNISDSWRSISAMQINISDTWRTVAGAQVNISDTWRTIF